MLRKRPLQLFTEARGVRQISRRIGALGRVLERLSNGRPKVLVSNSSGLKLCGEEGQTTWCRWVQDIVQVSQSPALRPLRKSLSDSGSRTYRLPAQTTLFRTPEISWLDSTGSRTPRPMSCYEPPDSAHRAEGRMGRYRIPGRLESDLGNFQV